MTVPATEAKAGPYTGNDSASAFAFDFPVFADGDIRVVETLIATEAETDLVLNDANGYTVTRNVDQDNNPGGEITYKQASVTTALPSTKTLTIVPDFDFAQPTDYPNGGGFFANVVERCFDRVTMLVKQLQVDVNRSVKVNVSSDTDPADLVAELLQAEADATAAADAAAVSETNAAASETNAAGSAAAAAAAAASVLWNDVVFKTFADSPITLTSADSGKLFAIDATGGAVTVNLPQISSLVLPFTLGIKKTDAGANAVTVNRAGTDTIDGGTSKTISTADTGSTFVPDTDTAPDEWTTADFGATVGQRKKQQFTAGVGFTVGSTTTLTITETPIPTSKDALTLHFDAAYQQENTWSYDPATGVVTLTSAIPIGTQKVETEWSTPLSIGTPADGSVTTAKINDSAVTETKIDPAYRSQLMENNTAQTLTVSSASAALAIAQAGAGAAMTVTGGRILTGGTDLLGSQTNSMTVSTGNSGVSSPSALGDDLIVESDGVSGITLAVPNTSNSNILFTDPDAAYSGRIRYDHTSDQLSIYTAGVEQVRLEPNGRLYTGVLAGITTIANSIACTGRMQAEDSYTSTTATAANLNINSSGLILRSTSTLDKKAEVEALDYGRALTLAKTLEGIHYRSTCPDDNAEWSWYGLAAEQVAAIDPRFAQWGYVKDDYEELEVEDGFEEVPVMVDEEYAHRVVKITDGKAVLTFETRIRQVRKVERFPLVDTDGNAVLIKDEKTGEETPAVFERVVTERVSKAKKIRRLKADAQMRPVGVAYERLLVPLLMVVQREVLGVDFHGVISPDLQVLIDQHCPDKI